MRGGQSPRRCRLFIAIGLKMTAKHNPKASLKVAIQMDPLDRLSKPADSTLYLAQAAARRGYELFHYEPQHLCMEIGKRGLSITARGHALEFAGREQQSARYGKEQTRDLAAFDIILMRQ